MYICLIRILALRSPVLHLARLLLVCVLFILFFVVRSFFLSGEPRQKQGRGLVDQNQNQNQNCLLVIRPRTIIHQDLCLGKLVPSPHKRSKLSNCIYCTLRSSDKGICHKVPISYSLGEETGLVYISPSHWDLECQGVMIPGTPDGGEQGHLWVYWLHPSDLCKAL